MFYRRLHQLYAARSGPSVSSFGFQIPKTVWSNQLQIIPLPLRMMATVMKWFGRFISIDECGAIMAPLFVEGRTESSLKSGRFLTWKKDALVDVDHSPASSDPKDWERLWNLSLELCADEPTRRSADRLSSSPASPVAAGA
jgi:hypothetical protein